MDKLKLFFSGHRGCSSLSAALLSAFLILPMLTTFFVSSPIEAAPAILAGENNIKPNLCQGAAAASWAASAITSKATTPATPTLTAVKLAADTGSYLANLGLKLCSPSIVAPDIAKTIPNPAIADATGATEVEDWNDTCKGTFHQPVTQGDYENMWGIPTSYLFAKAGDALGLTTWGDLGRPLVFHFNTSADVRLTDPNKAIDSEDDTWQPDARGNIYLPVGRNFVTWRADTKMALVDLAPTFLIPFVAPGDKIAKKIVMKNRRLSEAVYKTYGRLTRYGDGGKTRKVISKFIVGKIKDGLEELPKTVVEKVLDHLPTHEWRTNYLVGLSKGNGEAIASNSINQEVWVYDTVPPTLQTKTDASTFPSSLQPLVSYDPTTSTYYLEAIAPRIADYTVATFGKQLLIADDACQGNRPALKPARIDTAERQYWSVGDSSTFQWQVADDGPNLSGGSNLSNVVEQKFELRDSHPPALIAPPSQVLEIPVTASSASVNLGSPRVFDLADLSPDISNDVNNDPSASVSFTPGINTVTWTATDDAGNSVNQEQLINVKYEGANTTPMGYDQNVSAISYQPVDIILQGMDADVDPNTGRHDPLSFTIKDKPAHGFFIAPLLPYFINDYRLEASALRFAGQPEQVDPLQYCSDLQNGIITGPDHFQMNYPYKAEWFSVDDDGTTVVYDQGDVACVLGGGLEETYRLAVFDAQGDLLQHRIVNSTYSDIYIDWHTKGVYVTDITDPGQGDVAYYDKDLNPLGRFATNYTDTSGSHALTDPQFIAADTQGIVYVGQSYGRVIAYQGPTVAADLGAATSYRFLGTLHIDSNMRDIATDSKNNVYISLPDRILKFAASSIDDLGQLVPGALVGWMGRCDSNLDPLIYACDTVNHRSIGFSCTDTLCGTATSNNYGSDPAQFNDAKGIAVDPHDILYVSDYGNSRVQRFMPEGDFAGQAKSNGAGYGFVLGDFGRPDGITVNSDHFYILNRNLLHVLQTTPVTPIDDASAKVTYQSDNNFVGTDTFSFEASDGLASGIGTISVNVERDFRPPEINVPPSYTLNEDGSVNITLVGSDPDGSLDTLSYTIVEAPAHGSLSGVGADLVYTPDSDYYGDDSFSYRVGDGVYESEPATVALTITAVEDPPQITTEANVAEGLGFNFQFPVDVYDPDADESLMVVIDWGDGSAPESDGVIMQDGVAVTGDYIQADGTLPDNLEATGPLLNMETDGNGSMVFEHAYSSTGDHTAQICVSDRIEILADGTQQPTASSQAACTTTTFAIAERTDLLLSVEPDSDQADAGTTLPFSVTVTNRPFDITVPGYSSAATATNIVISGASGDDLTVTGISSSQATCTHDPASFTCDLNAPLAAGDSVTLSVTALIDSLAPGNALLTLSANRTADAAELLEEEGLGVVQVNASPNPPSALVLDSTTALTAGGATLTITGQDFDVYAEVLIDNIAATDVQVIDANTISLTVPAHNAGVVDVTVVNSDDQSITLSDTFEYVTQETTDTGGGGGGGGSLDVFSLMLLSFFALRPGLRRRRVIG